MGRAIVAGGKPAMEAPSTGILVSTLAVGTVIKLVENRAEKEWIVVNQGKPGNSTVYDNSCDGTWIMRKYVNGSSAWGVANPSTSDAQKNYIQGGALHRYMNETLYPQFDDAAKAAIKKVKVPYQYTRSTVYSGANGFEAWLFPIGWMELNCVCSNGTTSAYYNGINDGGMLEYFANAAVKINTACPARVAYDEGGTARPWFGRHVTPYESYFYPMIIGTTGSMSWGGVGHVNYARPLAVLNYNTLVAEQTLVVKGVA